MGDINFEELDQAINEMIDSNRTASDDLMDKSIKTIVLADGDEQSNDAMNSNTTTVTAHRIDDVIRRPAKPMVRPTTDGFRPGAVVRRRSPIASKQASPDDADDSVNDADASIKPGNSTNAARHSRVVSVRPMGGRAFRGQFVVRKSQIDSADPALSAKPDSVTAVEATLGNRISAPDKLQSSSSQSNDAIEGASVKNNQSAVTAQRSLPVAGNAMDGIIAPVAKKTIHRTVRYGRNPVATHSRRILTQPQPISDEATSVAASPVESYESPFLPDAKVEKRPLGGGTSTVRETAANVDSVVPDDVKLDKKPSSGSDFIDDFIEDMRERRTSSSSSRVDPMEQEPSQTEVVNVNAHPPKRPLSQLRPAASDVSNQTAPDVSSRTTRAVDRPGSNKPQHQPRLIDDVDRQNRIEESRYAVASAVQQRSERHDTSNTVVYEDKPKSHTLRWFIFFVLLIAIGSAAGVMLYLNGGI